ncbi:hypothetical protein NQ315_015869 [Exocentrus adspersus]|uniref:Pyridine nucleotide-disulfide oxidoreductase domain-containing protein 1 n=1 Tax=Exocentrus adspersus TaxID=1586481 RepID=A0AAV8W3J7_9CUCU|nr:hypothetical protein NQ315_015869 [Exocentrus adspersus]
MFSLSFLKNAVTKPLWSRPLLTTAVLKIESTPDQPILEVREITKDRTQTIPVETSIRYLKSAAFRKTYEGQPVWVLYRRNHKGAIPPKKTRKTCIRGGRISTGNPCPICRDEYLVLHEENTELLKHFICPHTGSILSYNKTGVCQKKHKELIVAIKRAYDKGLITYDVPFREYDYSEYYSQIVNLHSITKVLTDFDIKEVTTNEFSTKHSNVTVVHDTLLHIDDEEYFIKTKGDLKIKYKYLCLCVGAEPKLIPQANEFPEILGIRDTDSVESFVEKVKHSKKLLVVGNGGIASELVYKIQNAEVHWVIKDRHIAATFVDPGAAEFFQPSLQGKQPCEPPVSKRMRYQEEEFCKSGAALGPDWYKNLILSGANSQAPSSVTVHYQSEVCSVKKVEDSECPLEVVLTNGEKIRCNLVVSATGVNPRKNFTTKNQFDRSEDGGIKVDQYMRTNLHDVYCAGDICTADWPLAKHWFQMKLWTQARQMGCYAAKSMVGRMNEEEVLQDFCFEMFAHSTRLFGYKVILLGLFNGQKLGTNYEILLRMTKGQEYIKFVLEDNKLQGAVLIGDTDLEEMAENLILNQIDLSPYGDDILNPDIDIEDYFD